jgi:outer membrane protein W
MLKRFYIFCCCIFFVQIINGQHLQLIENRGEIGVTGGQASYRGDIAPDMLSFKNSYGAFYKKQYNDYAGFRFNYELIKLGANDTLSNNIYAKTRGVDFSRQLHDISIMGEFYFTKYLPGNKGYRFTPYLGFGVGYMIPASDGIKQIVFSTATPISIDSSGMPELKKTTGFVNFPIQFGFKFNLSQRWNLFAEAMYRFVNSDELDFLADEQFIEHKQTIKSGASFMIGGSAFDVEKIGAGNLVNKFQGSRSGKDQFFSAKVGISYNLIKIYGEEKWKPGNKPKSASSKNKGADEKKSGFFSRRKLNRK